MENCILNLRHWMAESKLKMNDYNIECLLIGTRQKMTKVDLNYISVGEKSIIPSSKLNILGALMDLIRLFKKKINY